jgi:hypothetical protein
MLSTSLFGAFYPYNLKIADACLSRIKHKSFYILKLDPGTYRFWGRITHKGQLDLIIQSGKTYFY